MRRRTQYLGGSNRLDLRGVKRLDFHRDSPTANFFFNAGSLDSKTYSLSTFDTIAGTMDETGRVTLSQCQQN